MVHDLLNVSDCLASWKCLYIYPNFTSVNFNTLAFQMTPPDVPSIYIIQYQYEIENC